MITKIFPATDESLADAIAFVEEELDGLGCSNKTVMQVTVCVEEMFVNVAHYAYGGKQGYVEIRISCDAGILSITLIDEGVAFDPLAKEDPDITLSAEERSIGGLGIFMVKETIDEVQYQRKDNKNFFTMRKKI